MARVKKNIVTEGLSGKLGNIVLRTRRGKTSAYILSDRKKPLSEKQMKVRQLFARANLKANEALKDPSERERFTKLAKETNKESALSAAISWYMKHETGE